MAISLGILQGMPVIMNLPVFSGMLMSKIRCSHPDASSQKTTSSSQSCIVFVDIFIYFLVLFCVCWALMLTIYNL